MRIKANGSMTNGSAMIHGVRQTAIMVILECKKSKKQTYGEQQQQTANVQKRNQGDFH